MSTGKRIFWSGLCGVGVVLLIACSVVEGGDCHTATGPARVVVQQQQRQNAVQVVQNRAGGTQRTNFNTGHNKNNNVNIVIAEFQALGVGGYGYGASYLYGYDPEKEILKLRLEVERLKLQQLTGYAQVPLNFGGYGAAGHQPQYPQQHQYPQHPLPQAPQHPQPQPMQPHMPQAPMPQGPVLQQKLLLSAAKCASCHDVGAVAGGKGGGLVLFQNNSIVNLSDAAKVSVARSVSSGAMPLGGEKLTPQEKHQVISEFICP